ncbi:MAG: two component transcriptional regulator, winged helix family [Dehalococcoidia bacterium]|nr:two component transcriptional regulator, winged helix family [Dehalococcoidia bacterium]
MERFLRTEKETLKLRLVAALGATAGLYFHQHTLSIPMALVLSIAYVLYVIYSLVLRYYILPKFSSVYLIYGMILVDTAALISTLFVTGTLNTALVILFPVFIIYYSIHLGYVGSLFAATTAAVGLVAFALLNGLGPDIERILPVQAILFYIVAAFSGYLGQKSIREQAEKEALQDLLNVESGARSLLDVAKTLNSTLDLDLLLQDITQLSPRITGLSKCVALLLDEGNGKLVGRASNVDVKELGVERIEDIVEVPTGNSLARRSWVSGDPVVLSNSSEGPDSSFTDVSSFGHGSVMAVPLISGGRPAGVLYCFDDDGGRVFTETELRLAKGYGDLTAMAVSNARLYQASQERIASLLTELEATVTRLERMREPRRRTVMSVNGLQIDTTAQKVSLLGRPVDLSPTEYRLLKALAETAGTPVSQEHLFRKTWGDVYKGQTNVVDVYIHRLRRKLEEDASSPKRILTVRGAGYKLSDN